MSLFGRLKRWFGLGGPSDGDRRDESGGDAGDTASDAPVSRRRETDATPSAATGDGTAGAERAPDASIPEAEAGSVTATDSREAAPPLTCAVCGTDADAGAAACPLCGSTDLRSPAAAAAADPVRRPVRTADDVSSLVEEAERSADASETAPDDPPTAEAPAPTTGTDASTSDSPTVDESTDVPGREPADEGADRAAAADRDGDDGRETESESDPVRFSGPGPTRTRSRRSETDDDAVARLQELRRADGVDDGDGEQA
jgi:hypothetical protein